MSKTITAFHYHLGGREVYEDRTKAETFTANSGLIFSVAAVCDGVGGRDRGERAAQLALDTLFQVLKQSSNTDIPALLVQAVKRANQVVYQEGQRNPAKFKEASSTLVVAVLVNNERLYIANVGDSRIYFLRDDKLIQLTLDHTFRNMMPLLGKMSWQQAAADRRAEVVMRAIGPRPDVEVDIGFYIDSKDPNLALQRGQSGMPLKRGDAILVCSDGLIKMSRTGSPYVTDEEITKVLMNQEGEVAARSLVSFALGRDADDNVSVALIQMPDPARAKRMEDQSRARRRRQILFTGGIVAGVIAIAALVIGFFINSNQQTLAQATAEAQALVSEQTRVFESATEEALYLTQAVEQTIAAYTPTPTLTPTPIPTAFIPPEAGQVAIGFIGNPPERTVIRERDQVNGGPAVVQLQVNHTGSEEFKDASFYARPDTTLQIDSVNDNLVEIALDWGVDIFVETGDYPGGVEFRLNSHSQIGPFVFGSCLSIDYDSQENGQVALSCYEGTCGYFNGSNTVPLATGNQVILDLNSYTPITEGPIPDDTIRAYDRLLREEIGGDGINDADSCLAVYIPTPTPTATPTILIPTRTPTATPTEPENSSSDSDSTASSSGGGGSGDGGSSSSPTNTPVPPAPTNTPAPASTNTPVPSTNTPAPAATNTPVPAATNTPVPPATDTPVPPPTDTPVPPPTDTPVPPPTDTPVPPPTDTPVPPPTDTPVPPPTDTPVPPPTDTPVPPPTDTPVPPPTDPPPPPTETPNA